MVIPDELPFPETDLCSLLMNLLDNALEAAAKVTPSRDRFLTLRINLNTGYLAIVCKNSFTGELKKDRRGNLLTIKEDALSHGFGYRQMKGITRKYNGLLHVLWYVLPMGMRRSSSMIKNVLSISFT